MRCGTSREPADVHLLMAPDDTDTTEEVAASATSMWDTASDALPRVGVAIAIVVIGWLTSRGLRALLRRWWYHRQTPSFAEVMSKVAGWFVVVIVTLLAIAVTFPSVRPVDILGGLGFFSLAIGFAFQDILENSLSGVLLLFRQPFRTGDQIEVQDRTGTVEAITIRETRLTTFDGQLVIIPNRDVYKSVIRVQTAYEVRRIEYALGISPDSDADLACELIVSALGDLPQIRRVPAPQAFVSGFAPSAVELTVWYWTDPRQADAIRTQHHAMTVAKDRLERAGIALSADRVVVQPSDGLLAALRSGE